MNKPAHTQISKRDEYLSMIPLAENLTERGKSFLSHSLRISQYPKGLLSNPSVSSLGICQ